MKGVSDSAWTLDSLPIGVWVGAVPGGQVVYTNQRFHEILGMAAVSESRIGDVPVTYHVRDRQGQPYPVEKLPFARAAAERRPVVVDDMVLHRADGEQVYLRAFGIPKLDEQGSPTEVVVAFIDITREVAVETERDLVNARLALVIDHAPVVIWAADMDGVVTLSEGAGLAGLGVSSGQLLGQNIFTLYGDHPTIPDFIRRGLAGESLFYTAVAGRVTFDTWMIPLRDGRGQMVGIAAMSHDVTEIRQLQTRAIQHDHQVALGLLAASVAHEINNPITYMMASASSLDLELAELERQLGTAVSPEVQGTLGRMRELITPIHEGATRIATITRDLRSFSRADDERTSLPIGDVVRSAVQLIGKEIEARARLTVQIDVDATVRANHARLLQVFLNLLTNAIQALSGDRSHEIGVVTRLEGAQVIIEVWDTGPGVPSELREQIFDPFVTTKAVGKGTGLGLFVCRNIVHSLGGTIEVGDAPGGGARFRIALPVDDEQVRRPSSPPTPVPQPPRTRILVIDDDPLVLRALVAQLGHQSSYLVTAIEDSERALRLLETERFDLVFCDLMMGGMTGMAIDRALQASGSPNAAKLVFMTGGAFTSDGLAFVRANAARVVDKPFDIVAETARRLSR